MPAREGFDPVYGAHPLKRTIQRRLQDPSINSGHRPLTMEMLDGRITDGATAEVGVVGGVINFLVN